MDKAKKKQIKKITTWVLLAALVAGLAAMPLLAKSEAEADGPVATVLSGTVSEGSITTSLHGGGTLRTEGVEDVVLPTGVKITEFLVKNGDTVTEGTPLAAVDKVSVMTAITDVTETMDYLHQEMKSAKDEKVSSTVRATAGGRVKKVFAQKGDSVQEVMLENNALALLSLDGLMAVKIEKKLALPTGQNVSVTLSDGTEVSGRVESNLDGVIVVTIEDEGYGIGETVTVATKDGEEVGSGELYVHNAWTATAYSGTIKTVSAKEETKVNSGATLFTLTDTDFKATLEYVSALHREYEALMQDLFKMYNSGTIDAPCAGTISGVDKDSIHLLSADEGHWQVTLLDHTPVQSFVAFAAKVTGISGSTWQLAVDPSLIQLETLQDLYLTPMDPAAMTQRRSYPAATVWVQKASGSLVPGEPAAVGDTLLFIGDESGVLWVVNPKDSVATLQAAAPGNVRLELLSDGEPVPQENSTSKCDSGGENCAEPSTDPTMHKPDCLKACTKGSVCDVASVHYPTCIKSCNPEAGVNCPGTEHHQLKCIKSCHPDGCAKSEDYPHYLNCIHSCTQSDGTKDCLATAQHYPGCIESCKKADDPNACPATPHHYPDCIRCCTSSKSASQLCPSSKHNDDCFFADLEYRAKVALVTQVGSHDLIVSWDASDMDYEVEKVGSGWKFATDQGFSLDLLVKKGTISISNPNGYKPGDVIFVVTGYNKNGDAVWTGIPVYIRNAGGFDTDVDMSGLANGLAGMMAMPDLSALLGGFSGFGSFGFFGATPVEEDKLFDLEGSVLMTVSPETNVNLTITLDEQDISKVSIGQKATVKVEALPGEVFDAEVIEVANRGTNSGGSSKFAVKLRLAKVPNMIDGMSASATLPLQTLQTIPVIPVAALCQQGAKTVVYTGLDEKTGEPTNPVPVTVGVSDAVNAQILEGLELGDTYYYSYYDTLELDTGVEDRFTLR